MKNRNVKIIDEHNIDRNGNVMFALELEGSEYVVYSVERDAESNNVFVSKVLKNVDGTYNMLNIDDADKKEDVSNIVKTLISNAVSDQNDKLVGTSTTLSNGKVVNFVEVLFNKEQHINIQKTYITTVKKEVTVVTEKYYDVIIPKVEEVAQVVTPVVEPITVSQPVVTPQPVVEAPVEVLPTPVVSEPVPEVVSTPVVEPEQVMPVIPEPEPAVVEPITVAQPTVLQQPVLETPVEVLPTPVVPEPVQVEPVVAPAPVVPEPVMSVPTVAEPVVVAQPTVTTQQPVVEAPAAVLPTPVVPEPVLGTPNVEVNQPLVFDASKEKNLNAALGEVANTATIPVENIAPVKEFGVDEPVQVPQQPVVEQPAIAPMVQPEVATDPKVLTKKAGFANSKFFMVVAVAFFLASCIFLGYEVFNYFQLIK